MDGWPISSLEPLRRAGFEHDDDHHQNGRDEPLEQVEPVPYVGKGLRSEQTLKHGSRRVKTKQKPASHNYEHFDLNSLVGQTIDVTIFVDNRHGR
jgi:hypothetical protein